MTTYEICYLNDDGSLAATLSALCEDAMKAKVLAHAMKLAGTKKIEVWNDRTLVYARPERKN